METNGNNYGTQRKNCEQNGTNYGQKMEKTMKKNWKTYGETWKQL